MTPADHMSIAVTENKKIQICNLSIRSQFISILYQWFTTFTVHSNHLESQKYSDAKAHSLKDPHLIALSRTLGTVFLKSFSDVFNVISGFSLPGLTSLLQDTMFSFLNNILVNLKGYFIIRKHYIKCIFYKIKKKIQK